MKDSWLLLFLDIFVVKPVFMEYRCHQFYQCAIHCRYYRFYYGVLFERRLSQYENKLIRIN
ncbi:hypothetical protein Xmir_03275 [Xenorhabdus miraniensis]|uniref:Uncharacterized protein n=1 Tax=Xenorhabdus miraniensis TaxID=351674 RepID=A0A2D0JM27_9GAMM|nr:hypothetical protein Xmir_03275 [Xenorhabdus miraniensis]